MIDFPLIIKSTFSSLSDFLMAEPFSYITGLIIVSFVTSVFIRLIKGLVS